MKTYRTIKEITGATDKELWEANITSRQLWSMLWGRSAASVLKEFGVEETYHVPDQRDTMMVRSGDKWFYAHVDGNASVYIALKESYGGSGPVAWAQHIVHVKALHLASAEASLREAQEAFRSAQNELARVVDAAGKPLLKKLAEEGVA